MANSLLKIKMNKIIITLNKVAKEKPTITNPEG